MAISTLAQGQEAKRSLRDFTPKYTIDTFELKGRESELRRRVIHLQQTEGIKSAYWDNESSILTVQYNSKLIELSAIKSFFFSNQSLAINNKTQQPKFKPAFECCKIGLYSLTSKSKK